MSCGGAGIDASRYVGDPIDVVTGANVDGALDFALEVGTPIRFHRFYSSAQRHRVGALGPGHRHAFEASLQFDVDGMRFVAADGSEATFPFLAQAGEAHVAGGACLRRGADQSYAVDAGSTRLTFAVRSGHRLMLAAVEDATGRIALEYAEEGTLHTARTAHAALAFDWRQGRLARVVWSDAPGGAKALISYGYDARGRLISGTDAYGHRFGFEYDDADRVCKRVDRRGYAFLFEYDALGRCTRARGEDGVLDVQLRYFPEARTTRVTKGDGGVWTYYYDSVGTLLQIIDPYDGVTVFVQDPQTGRVAERIDPQGNRTAYVYDVRGQLQHTTGTGGRAPARARAHRSPLGYEHGALLAPHEITPPTPLTLDPGLTVAASSVLARSEVPGSATFTPLRDPYGLRVRDERADGRSRRYAYDAVGNLRTYVDGDGHAWRFERSSWNHLTGRVDPLGHASAYAYNQAERLTELVDAGGTRSRYRWDLKDRLVEVARHDKVRERYVYDTADQLVEKRDATGELRVRYRRTSGGRVHERELTSGDVQTFRYDAGGQLVATKNEAGSCTFLRDASRRRREDLRDGLGVRHAYAGATWVEAVVLGRFRTRYRSIGADVRLVVDPTGRMHRVERRAHGVIVRRFAGGMMETAQYGGDGRCLAKVLERERPGAGHAEPVLLHWVRHHYSGEGNLRETRRNDGTARVCEYDAAGRLCSDRRDPARAPDAYVHDAAGNLLAMPGLRQGIAQDSGAARDAEYVALAPGNRIFRANGERFAYDARDHVAERARWDGRRTAYRYDDLDQLVEVRTHALHWTAKHDALGRRSECTANGARTQFFWDGDRLAAIVFADGKVRVYVYVDLDALVPMLSLDYASLTAEPESGRVCALFADHLGSVCEVRDLASEPVWQGVIAPYGAAEVVHGRDYVQPLRWPGHFYDDQTGLHYNRHREYDPALGRYLQSDPLGVGGGENLYAYAWAGNPLRDVDVLGLGCTDGTDDAEDREQAMVPQRPSTLDTNPDGTPYRPLSADEMRHIMEGDFRADGEFAGGGHGDPSVAALRANGYTEISPAEHSARRAAEAEHNAATAAWNRRDQAFRRARNQRRDWVRGGRQGPEPERLPPPGPAPEWSGAQPLMDDQRVFYRAPNRDGQSTLGGIRPHQNDIHGDGHTTFPPSWEPRHVEAASQHLSTSPTAQREPMASGSRDTDYMRVNEHGALEVAPAGMQDPAAHGYTRVTMINPSDPSAGRTLFPAMNQLPR